jgi:hypothetical protein
MAMTFRRGEFVSYGGRAGRVHGVESVDVAGVRLDALTIVHTGSPRAVVHVPLRRAANAVKRITEAQAMAMDECIEAPVTMRKTRLQKAAQQNKLTAIRERMAEFGRLGGLTKAKNRAA